MRNPFKREKQAVQEIGSKKENPDAGKERIDAGREPKEKAIENDDDDLFYDDDEGFDEYETRSRRISSNISKRPKKPASFADKQEEPLVTRTRVVRDLDKIHLEKSTTQVMNDLPTVIFAKFQMLQNRRDRKIIDEKIKINLREENEEFNEETQDELDELDDDSDFDDDFDLDDDDE